MNIIVEAHKFCRKPRTKTIIGGMVFYCAATKFLLRHKTPIEIDANSVTTLQLSDKDFAVVDNTDEARNIETSKCRQTPRFYCRTRNSVCSTKISD